MIESLPFTLTDLRQAMREGYDVLIDFVTSDSFTAMRTKIAELGSVDRELFIQRVLLEPDELSRYGVTPPEHVLIQRSAFGDRRPTLFCVKRYLPERFHAIWENVNLTFDSEYADGAVSREVEASWSAPIRPELQALFIAAGIPLSSVPPVFQVSSPFMQPTYTP